MKAATYILVLIVGVLTVQPVLSSQKVLAEMECCSKKGCQKSEPQEQEKKDCEGKGCHPFMACAVGNFYFTEKSILFSFALLLMEQKFVFNNDNRLSDKVADFWHPPENA